MVRTYKLKILVLLDVLSFYPRCVIFSHFILRVWYSLLLSLICATCTFWWVWSFLSCLIICDHISTLASSPLRHSLNFSSPSSFWDPTGIVFLTLPFNTLLLTCTEIACLKMCTCLLFFLPSAGGLCFYLIIIVIFTWQTCSPCLSFTPFVGFLGTWLPYGAEEIWVEWIIHAIKQDLS